MLVKILKYLDEVETTAMDIVKRDTLDICNSSSIDWNELKSSTILVTGATGLIGSSLLNALADVNRDRDLHIKLIGLVRDEKKAEKKLDKDIVIIKRLLDSDMDIEVPIDYIIHTANPTSSSYFVNSPVETIKTTVNGTINVLELAKRKKVKSFVYLSSMEVYGHPKRGHLVTENEVDGFDTMMTRNCYPQSKQTSEMLCKAYQSEYGLPTKVVRLTQTFGPGVEYNDGRVFAEFMRCAVEGKDIVLHTSGNTERCYLYIADAVTAILTVLTRGEPGQAYTAANIKTYCSIKEMAHLVAKEIAHGKIDVKIITDNINRGYAQELYMKLDTTKLENLGWKANVGLLDMYLRMIESVYVEET